MLKIVGNNIINNFFIMFPAIIFFLYYGIFPLILFLFNDNIYFVHLALYTSVAALAMLAGYYLNSVEILKSRVFNKISIDPGHVIFVLFVIFAVTFFLISYTAPSIPLISAFRGVDGFNLSLERAAFSKLRTGWEAVFPYANAALTAVVLPYLIALAFLVRSKYKWIILFLAILYCQLTIEKALFVKMLLPLIFLLVIGRIGTYRHLAMVLVGIVGLLYVNTVISKSTPEPQAITVAVDKPNKFEGGKQPSSGNDSNADTKYQQENINPIVDSVQPAIEYFKNKYSEFKKFTSAYFSAKYFPSNALDYVIWRAVAVPLYTAADAIYTFEIVMNGKPLLGATSMPIAKILGVERVPLDALVFGVQWGAPGVPSEYGRSNAFYVTEAIANFRLAGVVLFSLFVGYFIRLFADSNDQAFQGLYIGFIFTLFSGGLIGTLLSNGYLFAFLFAAFASVKIPPKSVQDRVQVA